MSFHSMLKCSKSIRGSIVIKSALGQGSQLCQSSVDKRLHEATQEFLQWLA